jgi:Phage integrase family
MKSLPKFWPSSMPGNAFAAPGPAGLVFIGPKGGRLRRSNFRKFWHRAREAVGMPELHFHDARHTGGMLAAIQGATIKELMARLGHSSPRAAMIYQHATRERDKVIADELGQLVNQARANSSGPQMAQPSTRKTRKRSKRLIYLRSWRREANLHDQLGRTAPKSVMLTGVR